MNVFVLLLSILLNIGPEVESLIHMVTFFFLLLFLWKCHTGLAPTLFDILNKSVQGFQFFRILQYLSLFVFFHSQFLPYARTSKQQNMYK